MKSSPTGSGQSFRSNSCERNDLVRLFELSRHLGQQLVARNADVDREAERPENTVLQMLRGQNRRTVEPGRARHIDPCFVDRILLDHGRNLPQKRHQAARGRNVERVIGLCHDKIRALVARHAKGLPCFYTVFFRRCAFGQHDARAEVFVVCNDRRNIPQIRASSLDERSVRSGPGQKRTVHIDMEPDGLCHQ